MWLLGGAIQSHFHVNEAIFGMVTNKQPNIQLDDPSASLLLTSENAVFCNKSALIVCVADGTMIESPFVLRDY